MIYKKKEGGFYASKVRLFLNEKMDEVADTIRLMAQLMKRP